MTDADATGFEDDAPAPDAADGLVLHLGAFDGPMDALLALAERQRIDLGLISIRALTEQFVAGLERLAAQVPLERRADWLVIAARLVQLRSRLLFPESPGAAAAADEAAGAIRQIETLGDIRAAAEWLQRRPQLGLEVFARPLPEAARAGGYVALMEACLAVLRGADGQPATAPIYEPQIPQLWRATDAAARIRTLLPSHPEGRPIEAFLPAVPAGADREMRARGAVSGTFLAGLELAREGSLSLEQTAAYGPVILRPAARM